jgi:hypothetical protein
LANRRKPLVEGGHKPASKKTKIFMGDPYFGIVAGFLTII